MTRTQRRIPDLTSLPHARVRDVQGEHPSDIALRIMRSEASAYGLACKAGSMEDIRVTAEKLKEAIERAVMGPDRNGCGND